MPKCCEDKMALKMVFLSLKRYLCIPYAFIKLLLSRVIFLSLEEIDEIFQCPNSLRPSHIPARWIVFLYYTIASSCLTHLTCFSGAVSPLPVASITFYMLVTSQTILPARNLFPRFLTSCLLESPLPACPTRYCKL